jgi:hypothetical protein
MHRRNSATVSAAAVALTSLGIAILPAMAAEGPPNFAPNSVTAWVPVTYGDLYESPPDGPGPVTDDPAHPFVSNREFGATGRQPTFHIADLSNPILQPWTREELRKRNEHILSGKPGYSVQASCIPLGVPAFLIHPVQPLYFIQTPTKVFLINQEDLETRRVYLNVAHSASVTPSWYGESVGHYEGDTLVVDTIGLNLKTFMDNFRTPHSDRLHVVERFRMINGGSELEATIHVQDEGAFTTPWKAIQRWRRVEAGAPGFFPPLYERFCPDGQQTDFFNQETDPVPQADKPDF